MAAEILQTTAMPPALAAALLASLEQIAAGQARRDRLRGHVETLRAGLAGLPHWRLMPSATPIQPLLIGGNAEAVAVSRKLLELGLLVPAIRTPTVPRGTARLRIAITLNVDESQIANMIGLLALSLAEERK